MDAIAGAALNRLLERARRDPDVLAVILFAPTIALADIPSPETIQQELSGAYRTTAPSPPLNERGPIARRIEKLLGQQARWLVSTIHPWQNDPRAALLTKGGSIENEIRPNAHTACGLAMLARCAPERGRGRGCRRRD